MSLLHNGQQFPSLVVPVVGGGTISLPGDLAGSYGVVLIYRGSWCPYCNAQLASFSRAVPMLAGLGAKVVALSVDDEAAATGLAAKHKLAFPVGHSADARAVAAATGAYVNDDPRYLRYLRQPGQPDRHILTADREGVGKHGSGLSPPEGEVRSGRRR